MQINTKEKYFMAKLYFKYGTLNASKSANLLMTAYNYEQQGKKIALLKPSLDTREKGEFITSRATLEKKKCTLINQDENIFEIIKNIDEKLDCILIDEAQFLTKKQVKQLLQITDELNINVICFGLKNTYIDGVIFEGSQALLYYADDFTELKSVCSFCNKKATMNLRIKEGKPFYENEGIIAIGDINPDKNYYLSVCRKHYFNPINIK